VPAEHAQMLGGVPQLSLEPLQPGSRFLETQINPLGWQTSAAHTVNLIPTTLN